jgi:hypothetical protein
MADAAPDAAASGTPADQGLAGGLSLAGVQPLAGGHPLAEDRAVAEALRLARLWRRLAEQRSWAPLADPASLRALLAQLGCHVPAEDALADWLAAFAGGPGRAGRRPEATEALPALPRAGQAAQAWAEWEPGEGRGDRLSTAALFLAACLWRRAGGGPSAGRGPSAGSGPATGATPSLALPVWSATPRHLERLALTVGPAWLGGFLTTVTDAARRAGQDLTRLQIAAERAAALRRTARSRLPAAAALALRQPVLTARGLAERLRLSPQAALGLLNQLVAAGVLKEATGRAAWRAFVVA